MSRSHYLKYDIYNISSHTCFFSTKYRYRNECISFKTPVRLSTCTWICIKKHLYLSISSSGRIRCIFLIRRVVGRYSFCSRHLSEQMSDSRNLRSDAILPLIISLDEECRQQAALAVSNLSSSDWVHTQLFQESVLKHLVPILYDQDGQEVPTTGIRQGWYAWP